MENHSENNKHICGGYEVVCNHGVRADWAAHGHRTCDTEGQRAQGISCSIHQHAQHQLTEERRQSADVDSADNVLKCKQVYILSHSNGCTLEPTKNCSTPFIYSFVYCLRPVLLFSEVWFIVESVMSGCD